ncbi:hypothetical protein [Aquimarina agarivorans]|uniref:hypothetical protein n=1 Tax=Aquimarina agarivorans TaxID=980584 RepID=UPI000248E59F|nr:hypothetical protein [Aquimarina agarivorans]
MVEIEEKALKNNTLYLNPEGLYTRYGCMIIFEDNHAKNALRYKLEIKYIGKSEENNNIFRIDRNPEIYINDTSPEANTDELAAKVSQVIYPLEIETTARGTLHTITNFKEVQTRWQKVKRQIKSYYQGESVDQYIALNDKTLIYPSLFQKKMAQDWFLHLFFAPIYGSYPDDAFNPEKSSFIISPSYNTSKYYVAGNAGPVSYKTINKIKKNPSGPIHFVKIKGELHDERCALDLEQELEFPYYKMLNPEEKALKGTCDLTYGINKKTGVIEGIEAFFDTQFENPKKVTVKMFALEQVEEKEEVTTEKKATNSFWSKFLKKANK